MNTVKSKILTAILSVIVLFCLFTGCTDVKYNAVLYSQVNEWIDEAFLKDNRVKAYYLNENYYGESDPIDKYIYDTTSPSSREFIITDEDEFNRIFSNSHLDINFEHEIVILYIFSDVNPNRAYKLKRIELNNNILTVETELESKDTDDATMPYQRCFVLKMNKINFEEVIFE